MLGILISLSPININVRGNSSYINAGVRNIYHSLILLEQNYTSVHHFHKKKKTRIMDYNTPRSTQLKSL